MYVPRRLKLIQNGKGKALLAAQNIKKGATVLKLAFDSVKKGAEASQVSMQIGEDAFIDSKHLKLSDFINHSCNPNLKVDYETMNFVSLRDIKIGEELCFNYLTTEYDMLRDYLDFDCKCGSQSCVGRIRGFKFLSPQQQLALKPLLSSFLQQKL